MYSLGRRSLLSRIAFVPTSRNLFSGSVSLKNVTKDEGPSADSISSVDKTKSKKDFDAIEKFFQQDFNNSEDGNLNDVFQDIKLESVSDIFNVGKKESKVDNERDHKGGKLNDSTFDLFEKLGNLSSTEQNNEELGVEDLESKYIHEEQETMLNIFNKYLGNQDLSYKDKEGTKPYTKTESINEMIQMYSDNELSAPVTEDPMRKRSSIDISLDFDRQIADSLKPSIKLIENDLNLWQSYQFFESLQTKWKLINNEEMYLRDIMRDSSKKKEQLLYNILEQSTNSPGEPIINVFTLPILFNKLIKTIAFKFQDPQLSSTLFNLLKKDLNFYTICCNQQTYNEILRINWIFNGKSNLYGIEMILLEMINNGFLGDLITFNLLEMIIVDYHNMKMGIDLHESKRVRPIWNLEDDKRVQNLERKFHEMGGRLRNDRR
ncbi:hypothetical protein CLIB1423_08S04236 [[Candida] railenensis]|uniref:Mtf2-like C-terminal domain-containing protein n=1 Tax=[Candida] railenensis TaxID=45579 RepID=A0A9P0QQL9_9ASCO|nr:hypothetical protein CLIB1423_08S04236 [[Candida] railenensis]